MENRPNRSRPAGPKEPSPAPPGPEETDQGVDPDRFTPTPQDREISEAEFYALGATRILGGEERAGPETSPDDTDVQGRGPNTEKELSVLGDFELLKKLGEGAMGVVWKARQISFDRIVALKVLFPHVASNKKLVKRLEREGHVMFHLEHPNIISAYAVDEAEGQHYVAMEYVDGDTLQQWLDRLDRFSVPDAVAITLACAHALEYAHKEGMVHRDIKPDNVLIARQGIVKVADLGMVKTVAEDMSLTQTGHAVGTPWYMPLEQARMAKDADGRCDIYALGCMLYCLLTGNPPFNGPTIVEVIQAKEIGTFPPARNLNAEVPERLDLIIAKMTAKKPDNRYQNCTALIKDLESLGLAASKLNFLEGKAAAKPATPMIAKGDAETEVMVDEWYVRVHFGEGQMGVRKLTAAQLNKMLEEGTVDPTAQASRLPKEGFRSLSTFKEFQKAFVKQTKKAADMHSDKYRNLYKKIEDKQRLRDEEEKRNEVIPSYYSLLWTPGLLIAVSIGGVAIFLYIVFKLFFG
jgi:serine/threonine protein kinase